MPIASRTRTMKSCKAFKIFDSQEDNKHLARKQKTQSRSVSSRRQMVGAASVWLLNTSHHTSCQSAIYEQGCYGPILGQWTYQRTSLIDLQYQQIRRRSSCITRSG